MVTNIIRAIIMMTFSEGILPNGFIPLVQTNLGETKQLNYQSHLNYRLNQQ